MRLLLLCLLPCLMTATLAAQEPAPAPAPPSAASTNLPIKAVAPGVFELGLVRFDKQQRSVSFPAFVNLREGVIEYLLVTSNGKTHETVLRTDAEPYHIHVALLLLGARGAQTNSLSLDPAQPLPGDAITVEVVWKKKKKEIRVRAETLVFDRKKKKALSKGDWTYTGSRLREDGFAAQFDGSIVALITDPDALVNNPRPDRDDDDAWLAKAKNLPAFNEPVQIVFTLTTRLESKPPPK